MVDEAKDADGDNSSEEESDSSGIGECTQRMFTAKVVRMEAIWKKMEMKPSAPSRSAKISFAGSLLRLMMVLLVY